MKLNTVTFLALSIVKKVQEWLSLPLTELGELFDGGISRWNGIDTFDDDVSMVVLEYKGKRESLEDIK